MHCLTGLRRRYGSHCLNKYHRLLYFGMPVVLYIVHVHCVHTIHFSTLFYDDMTSLVDYSVEDLHKTFERLASTLF